MKDIEIELKIEKNSKKLFVVYVVLAVLAVANLLCYFVFDFELLSFGALAVVYAINTVGESLLGYFDMKNSQLRKK